MVFDTIATTSERPGSTDFKHDLTRHELELLKTQKQQNKKFLDSFKDSLKQPNYNRDIRVWNSDVSSLYRFKLILTCMILSEGSQMKAKTLKGRVWSPFQAKPVKPADDPTEFLIDQSTPI